MILHNLTKVRLFRIILRISYPFAWLMFFPLAIRRRNEKRMFFFFDRYSIGGAQKIHMDVLESVKDLPKWVYFTRRSFDTQFKERFYSVPNTISRDVHMWCDYLLFRVFSVHYFSFLVNSYKDAVIFSSNSTFFYDMLPFIKRSHVVIEMLHNFTYGKKGMEFFGLANYRYMDTRIVYDSFTHQNLVEQYKQYKIPQEYTDRIRFIEYGVSVPSEKAIKPTTPPLKVLYAGRGAAQKRIWLLNRIVKHFIKDARIQFIFAGSMIAELDEAVKAKSRVYSEIGDQKEMEALFSEAHVIILTSAFEGFPVVIKEGMSFACIPVVTALPGNKMHLQHLSNSLLIENFENENFVVEEAIRHLEKLINEPTLVTSLSTAVYQYAKLHFAKDSFLKAHRELITSPLNRYSR